MKSAIFASIALSVGAFLSTPAEAQPIQKPTLLRCPSVGSGFVLKIKIERQNIWVNDRPQRSIFSETDIQFSDDALPGYFHILDRTNGRLTVYNDNREIDSVYNCQIVDKVMF